MNHVRPLQMVEVDLKVNEKVTALAFIFGIGLQGLAPFERLLEGKIAGRSICASLSGSERRAFFGHLACQVSLPEETAGDWQVGAEIKRVSEPPDRMVVEAMAHLSACEHNGCGGHGCCGH